MEAVGSKSSAAAGFFDPGLMQRALDPLLPQLCWLASGVRAARCSQSFQFWLDSVQQPLPGVANRLICSLLNIN